MLRTSHRGQRLWLLVAIAALALASRASLQRSAAPARAASNQLINWPFDPSANNWEIEHGYNTGPDHGCLVNSNKNFCYELYSFDFQVKGNAGSTAGQPVISPATGPVVNIGAAYGNAGDCLRVSFDDTKYAGYHIIVCHVDPSPSLPAHAVQGQTVLGKVDSASDYGDHIHMTLYYLDPTILDVSANATKRVAHAFSDPWMIGGCNYPAQLAPDGNPIENLYGSQNLAVPCDSSATPTGVVDGYVKTLADGAVAGATVTFKTNGAGIAPATTDANGHYQFANVPLGRAQIIASKPGAGSNSIQVVVASATTAPDIILTSSSPVSIALIIDSSGSMAYNDPTDLRKAAAKLFVQALDTGNRLAVVDFDTYARTIWPLQAVGGQKSQIEQAIDAAIDSYGSTDISSGLREAFTDLNDGSTGHKVAVLLTDGQQEAGPYDPQWQADFQRKGWPVYTFGLSNQADAQLLQAIASATSGSYQALSSATQLSSFYNSLRSRITGAHTLLDQSAIMYAGDVQLAAVSVPASSRVATFVTSWPGSTVDTVLQAPDGTLIAPDTSDALVSHTKESTFEIYQVQFPQTGTWHMVASGASLNPAGERVTLQADASLAVQHAFVPFGQVGGAAPPAAPTRTPIASTPTSPPPTPTLTPTPPPTPTITGTLLTPTPTSTPGQPPAAPDQLQAVPAGSTEVQLSWRDNAGDEDGYWVYDGSNLVAALGPNSTATTIAALAPGSYHCFTVYAFNGYGSSPFAGWACTTTPPATCLTSAGSWQNSPIASESSTLTVEFDATPASATIDGVIGLAAGPASAYTDLAVIARFNPSGYIDARNGAAYQAVAPIGYTAGITYHFSLEIDLVSHTYNVYVARPGEPALLVGANFAFRSEQASVASLAEVAIYAKTGSVRVCGLQTRPAPNYTGLGGTWSGGLYQSGTLSFYVSNTGIVEDGYAELGMSGCPGNIHDFGPATIIDNHFVDFWQGGSYTITVNGIFYSSNYAAGQYIVQSNVASSPCDVTIAWSMTR